jgi:tetratricopeptide (TPR) repeat protein
MGLGWRAKLDRGGQGKNQSLPLREQAVESTKGFGERSHTISLAGEGSLLAGQIGDATKLAEQALRLSRTSKERGFEAWALRLLGEISARRDPPEVERAESHYREALVLATGLGVRPLVAHCHVGLGMLYRRTKRQEAQEHLATATTMYREMDMPYWLEQVETEMS